MPKEVLDEIHRYLQYTLPVSKLRSRMSEGFEGARLRLDQHLVDRGEAGALRGRLLHLPTQRTAAPPPTTAANRNHSCDKTLSAMNAGKVFLVQRRFQQQATAK